jgi:chemotaxis protein CheD
VTDLSTATATDVVVRMGELVASASAGDVLVCVGLGSCIGLALVCRYGRACGLAHIVLPDSGGREGDRPAKFAERAVPALIGALGHHGVRADSLEAILVGGAQMFSSMSAGMEIGARNEAAVRAELRRAGIPVTATATAGSMGRTVRVHVATGHVTVREAGSNEVTLR